MITYWLIGYLDEHSDMLTTKHIRYLLDSKEAYREYQQGLLEGIAYEH